MHQLLQNLKTGRTELVQVPIPTPRHGQALVRVSASLVSAGTERMLVQFAEKNLLGKAQSRPDLVRQLLDKMQREGIFPTLQAAFNRLDEPLPLGYSSAGVITALGTGMEGFTMGQRVACAGGGYAVHAEYNLVPRNLLTPIPEGVDQHSAAFTTLAAIALHGFRLAQPQLDETVGIIGLGLLGLLAGQIAHAAGCRVIGIDLDPRRVALAESLGLVAVLRPDADAAALSFTRQRGLDHILICADTPSDDPVTLAAAIARERANIVAVGAVGLNLPRKPYYEKELNFINSRSYGPGRYDPAYEENGRDYPIGYVRWTEGRNFEAALNLMARGSLRVQPLISHRIPISEGVRAYDLITGKTDEPFLGVLLTYPEAAAPPIGQQKIPLAPAQIPSGAAVTLGVLGAGLFANATLLPAIQKIPQIARVGIASSGGAHAQHSGKKFGFAYAASHPDEILNDPNINTVAILTRHNTHAHLTQRALAAGKHVFVEKPLALTHAELDAVEAALAEHSQQVLMVGFNRRFAPLAVELARFLAGRREPLYLHYRVNAGFLPANHWLHDPQVGGGRILGEACHFVDFAAFLVGAAPLALTVDALPDVDKYRGDNASLRIAFPDGSRATVDYLANGDKSYPKERVEVFCEGKIAVLDDFRSLEMVRDGKRTRKTGVQDKGHRAEMQALAQAILHGGAPPIPYAQIFGVMRVLLGEAR
ncbi:MAG: bi-domain-containing oxidoreductase [Anaerolineales bacterium]